VARPTSLNAQTQRRIIEAVRQGASLSYAAKASGVDSATLRRWRRKGEIALKIKPNERSADEKRYARFCTALERALCEVEIKACAVIVNAMDIDFETASIAEMRLALRAATWFLVRRDPENYGNRPVASSEVASRPPAKEPTVEEGWATLQAIFSEDIDRWRVEHGEN